MSTETRTKAAPYRTGERINEYCPYDEATLRVDLERPGWHVCPCCFSAFVPLGEKDL